MDDKYCLGLFERRVLIQSLVERAMELFYNLEDEVMELDVMDYFEKYYKKLYVLIRGMEIHYPREN